MSTKDMSTKQATMVYKVETPAGITLGLFTTADIAKDSIRVSCSKLPGEVFFDYQHFETWLAIDQNGAKYMISPTFIYNYPEHL